MVVRSLVCLFVGLFAFVIGSAFVSVCGSVRALVCVCLCVRLNGCVFVCLFVVCEWLCLC